MWRLVWIHICEKVSSCFEDWVMLTFAHSCLVLSQCRFLAHTCAGGLESPVQSNQDMLLVDLLRRPRVADDILLLV